jgi:uncharacterized protein YbbC (DUF1343 family)
MTITLGLERCLQTPPDLMRGRRFGLLLNQASVDCQFQTAHTLLRDRFPGQLAALFGPQHGLFSAQQDNMIETAHTRDARLDIPIYSLYADQRKPSRDMLNDLDLFVIDLQDVGTRVYTYIWTLSYCLEACADQGIPVLILDRPNPLGGVIVEGPLLNEDFASFVGRASIPMRHGLTIGEMALTLNDTMAIGADVQVVTMQGWQRDMLWPDTERPWIPTSPNLPRFTGVQLYPGQVLIEGTRLSEGRGTCTPFEVVGAPYIDPDPLIRQLDDWGHPGLALRPIRFEPTFQKYAHQSCAGLFLHPLDDSMLRPYRFTLALIGAILNLWPDHFAWLPGPYEYETELAPIDMLTGDDHARRVIDQGLDKETLDDLSKTDLDLWTDKASPYRLYPGPMFTG